MKTLKPIFIGIALLALVLFLVSFFSEGLASFRWWFLLAALIPLSLVPHSRTIRAACGTGVLAALVFFLTQILGQTGLGRKNIDLTEDDRYTLTDGTRAILGELTEPVVINYYVTRDLRSTPADLKRYIPRIDSLLEEFAALANDDNISINFIDPKPNTDEEDAAALDQIQEIPVSQDENLFFGASISSWDQKTVIPFFNPQNETQLEFDLISAIAEVSATNKPTVGLISALNISSSGRTGQGWIFYQYLKRAYNAADLGMKVTDKLPDIYEQNEWGDAPTHLDPVKIPVILVVHPAEITEEAEYHLDQYLLRGGTVVACVDSFSVAAQQSRGQQPQIPGLPPQQQGTPTFSSLPKLFYKHGIQFNEEEVLADGKFGMEGNPTVIKVNREAMPVEDAIALSSISDLLFPFAGAFTEVKAPGLEVSRLIRSSLQSDFIPSADAVNQQTAANLRYKLRTDDRQYDLLLALSGKFTTAFPKGNPSKPEDEEKETAEDAPADSSLKEGEAKGNLYLFADSDFLYDGAAYRLLQIGGGGGGIPQQLSDNGPLVFNILDQATNSKHLIGARARTPNWRPFTVFQEMTSKFEEKAGEDIEQFEKEQEKAAAEIQQLQAQRQDSGSPFLNEQQQEALKALQQQEVDARQSIRELQKENQSQIDSIKAGVFWKSLLTVPAIVTLLGLGIFIFRSERTQAR